VHLNISMAEGRRQLLRAFGATLAVWLLILSLLTASLNPVVHAQSSQVTQESAPSVKPDLKKAKEAYQQGVRAEKAQDWETAYTAYSDAVNWAPNDRGYFLRREIAKSGLVQTKADAAEKDAISGRLDAARRELLSASFLDPTNTVVRERLRELLAAEPGQILQTTEPELGGPVHLEYQPGTRTFDYRGDTQGAYGEIARQFGVEAAFDIDLRSHVIRFRAEDVDFATAMRLLGDMTHTFWRPLARRLFFVAEDSPEKRRDYAASLVRTILLPASQTPDQMTEISRLVRDVAGVTRSELDTNSRTLTLRASPQAIAVATDLIEELEKPAGEMVLEIEILEVDRNYARQIGITPPQTAQVFTFSSQQIQEAEQSEEGLVNVIEQVFGASSLSAIPPLVAFGGGQTTFLATLPGAAANLSRMLSLVLHGRRVLLRAQDGQPATFFVGERYPVSLSSYSSSLLTGSGVTTEGLPIANYAAGNSPTFVATASLRNNGMNDLIVSNGADNTLSVLLGNGDGTFATQVLYDTGTDPVSIATGEFDNGAAATNSNDFIDLAVADKSANTVSILLGNGDGTFGAKTDIATGNSPVSVISANFHDLTSSTGVDLAVANQGDNSISIFQGNGDGTFKTPTLVQLPKGFEPASLAAFDLNGDGHTDLVVADEGNNTFSVLLGKGDGTFQPRTDYPTGNDPVYVTFGDFTGNGAMDIAVADNGAPTSSNSGNAVTIYYNQINTQGGPTGTFVAGATRDFPAGNGPTSIAVADYNLDGLADITVADETDNAVSILINLGSETFAANYELPVDKAPVSIATADFNGDGRLDVATANNGAADTTVILNSTTLFGGLLGAGETPFPSVEYLDIGLKVKATPRIHPNDDVTLTLAFDISGLAGQSFNSIPVINNQTVEQTVRLKQNETAMLAGFIQGQVTKAITGTPGLVGLPGIEWLDQSQNLQDLDSELLILVTPRMVRLAPRKDHVIYAGQGSIEGTSPAGGGGALGGVPPPAGPAGRPQPGQPPTAPPPQQPVEPTPEPVQQPPPQQPPVEPGQQPPVQPGQQPPAEGPQQQ
jgi:Bacterial type II and III secretion system protein/FG-GAP-like repeat